MTGYRPRSKELTKAVTVLYKDGLSPKEVAKKAGCALSSVYAVLHCENLEIDTSRRAKMRDTVELTSYGHINPIWAAEFRGFFYADGSAAIFRAKNKGHYYYRPILRILLRDDNKPLLLDIQEHLGGSVCQKTHSTTSANGYICNPTAAWKTGSYANILAVIEDVLLPGAKLPAVKRSEIELLREAVLARLDMPYTMRAEDREVLHDYYIRIKDLKRYKGSSG